MGLSTTTLRHSSSLRSIWSAQLKPMTWCSISTYPSLNADELILRRGSLSKSTASFLLRAKDILPTCNQLPGTLALNQLHQTIKNPFTLKRSFSPRLKIFKSQVALSWRNPLRCFKVSAVLILQTLCFIKMEKEASPLLSIKIPIKQYFNRIQ